MLKGIVKIVLMSLAIPVVNYVFLVALLPEVAFHRIVRDLVVGGRAAESHFLSDGFHLVLEVAVFTREILVLDPPLVLFLGIVILALLIPVIQFDKSLGIVA